MTVVMVAMAATAKAGASIHVGGSEHGSRGMVLLYPCFASNVIHSDKTDNKGVDKHQYITVCQIKQPAISAGHGCHSADRRENVTGVLSSTTRQQTRPTPNSTTANM